MAHDYLGTFNSTQFARFISFARSQLPLLPTRIDHLEAELLRVGELTFVFDSNNVPTQVYATEGSYVAKLLAAYEVLGGNPFLDLKIRNRTTQPVFVVRGTGDQDAQYLSDGRPLTTRGLLDARSANLMRDLRDPIQETLRVRFEALERKLRRAVDYSDELRKEIARLRVYQLAATEEGSLEYVASRIEALFSDRGYRAIFTDEVSGDPLGLNTYAPFSQYDVERSTETAAPDREVRGPQRQDSGFVAPGGRGST